MIYNLTLFFLLSIIILSEVVEMYRIPIEHLTMDVLFNENTQKIINNFLVDVGYKGIYMYSLLQIKCNAVYKHLLPYIEEITNSFQKKDEQDQEIKTHVELVCKDGTIINKVIVSKLLKDINNDDINNHLNDKVELMIITDYNKNKKDANTGSNKICISKNVNDISNCDVSNIKFIDLTITYNGDTHKIQLKNDEHNFYVVNNKIDETFLKYYLTNILNINVEDTFKYDMQLIDHEVNISLLDNNHSIIIEKDSYRIEQKDKLLVSCETINFKENERVRKGTEDDISEEYEKIENVDSSNN